MERVILTAADYPLQLSEAHEPLVFGDIAADFGSGIIVVRSDDGQDVPRFVKAYTSNVIGDNYPSAVIESDRPKFGRAAANLNEEEQHQQYIDLMRETAARYDGYIEDDE